MGRAPRQKPRPALAALACRRHQPRCRRRPRRGRTKRTARAGARLLGRPGPEADPRALYTVWAGGNDLLAAGFASGADAAGRDAAAAVGEAVATLGAAGARTLLVPNLPDIGITPALQAVGPPAAADARRRSLAYDDALARVLDRVEARHPGVAILRLDVQALTERVLADPGAAGFRDVTNPCQGRPSCEGALFWDPVHPSTHAHARLAAAASTLIETAVGRKLPGQSG